MYLDKHIQCPYFKRIDFKANRIVCEGVDGVVSTMCQFQERKALTNFVFERCASNYCLCCVCRGISEFYEGDEE